jgi:hypothetical protein
MRVLFVSKFSPNKAQKNEAGIIVTQGSRERREKTNEAGIIKINCVPG